MSDSDEEERAFAPRIRQFQTHRSGCRAMFMKEFQFRNFGLTFHKRSAFYTSQWEWPPVVFLLYRVVAAGYILGWLVYTLASAPTFLGHPWLVWLSNWSYTLLACHLVVSLLITVCHLQQTPFQRPGIKITVSIPPDEEAGLPNSSSATTVTTTYGTSTSGSVEDVEIVAPEVFMPWYLKFQWLVFATISNLTIIVTVIFYAALYPMMNHNRVEFLIDFHIHGMNSIVILLEMCLSALPVRILHVLYPILCGLCYLVFSIVYWSIDPEHNVLYPGVLDWNHTRTTLPLVVGLILFISPALQLLLWAAYKLRLCLYNHIYSTRTF